ncbi:putative uncharacterized protein DDB_G0293878 [Achroia grisella]|uniref:putative uncharacterized protein DDB_G0293878 n=1 Tax=Achroia grisella TaxID=688607 RepID=UPI0027D25FF1|nr:putative uncharacterized protein DDB_G0293878 [Achroia grisella]
MESCATFWFHLNFNEMLRRVFSWIYPGYSVISRFARRQTARMSSQVHAWVHRANQLTIVSAPNITREICFCNNHLSDNSVSHKRNLPRSQRIRINQRTSVLNKNKRQSKQSHGGNNEITQIDVASFIQKPDYYDIDDNVSFNWGIKDRLTSRVYYDYDTSRYTNTEKNVEINNTFQEYLSVDETDILKNQFIDIPNTKSNNAIPFGKVLVDKNNNRNEHENNQSKDFYRNKLSLATDNLNNSVKKLSIKHLKWPVFFHNNTDKYDRKKGKKRIMNHKVTNNLPNTVNN